MSIVDDGLTSHQSKGGFIAVASTTSLDAFLAGGLLFIAFDLSDSNCNVEHGHYETSYALLRLQRCKAELMMDSVQYD